MHDELLPELVGTGAQQALRGDAVPRHMVKISGGDLREECLAGRCDLNLIPSVEQKFDSICDGPTDLDNQPAAGLQRGVRLRNQSLDHFYARGSCEDRIARLKLADFELHLVFFGFANVGRIRYHKIKHVAIETLQQIGLWK